ncbi:MAG: phosphoribosylanthranilate isomerase [Tumebacillaceae bacterium]
MTVIKVCGIKTKADFAHLQELAADYVGFVFAKSKRQVTAEQVADLTADVDRKSKLVGVFVDEAPDEVLRIARVARLDVLQLHGSETPEQCHALREASGLTIWKAWGVCHDPRDAALAEYRGVVDAVLLDNERGGTGQRFSWDAIETLKSYLPGVPLFVAGGLDVENVGELVANHRPYGVDVSSGVETDGAKDQAKITAFMTRVRESR